VRWLALLLVVLASPAWGAPQRCVVLPVRAAGVPPSLVALADASLGRAAASAGACALVAPAAVADMTRMLKVPAEPGDADLSRLAGALMAGWALTGELAAEGEQIRVRVAGCTPTGGCVSQSSTVPAAQMLPTLERLVAEVLRSSASSQPAAASQPTSRSVAASRPVTTSPPAATSPPVARQPARPAQTAAPAAVPPQPPPKRATRRRRDIRALVAAGVRGYYLKSWDRAGPLTELELGASSKIYRAGLLLRAYFGDRTGYYLGGRGELGPRIGPVRLSFGADFGFLFIPDTIDAVDMMVLNLHPAGVVTRLGPVVLHLDAFSFDIYVVPAAPEIGRDPEALYGFSAGLTAGVEL
jgi:hypothetical protein